MEGLPGKYAESQASSRLKQRPLAVKKQMTQNFPQSNIPLKQQIATKMDPRGLNKHDEPRKVVSRKVSELAPLLT